MTAEHAVLAIIGAMFVGGIGCVVWAARVRRRTRQRDARGGVVDGHVIRLDAVAGSTSEPLFITVAEFRDRRGTLQRVHSKVAMSPASHQIGERLRVSFDVEAPERAEIVPPTRWLITVAVFGLVLAVIAALLAWGLRIGAWTIT